MKCGAKKLLCEDSGAHIDGFNTKAVGSTTKGLEIKFQQKSSVVEMETVKGGADVKGGVAKYSVCQCLCAGLPHRQCGHTMIVLLAFDCTIIARLHFFSFRFACNRTLIVVYVVFCMHLLSNLHIDEFLLVGVELRL